jgi:hypothetical protein
LPFHLKRDKAKSFRPFQRGRVSKQHKKRLSRQNRRKAHKRCKKLKHNACLSLGRPVNPFTQRLWLLPAVSGSGQLLQYTTPPWLCQALFPQGKYPKAELKEAKE